MVVVLSKTSPNLIIVEVEVTSGYLLILAMDNLVGDYS